MSAPDPVHHADPSKPPSTPRPAATVVVLRDGAQGLEVLLLRRAERGDHFSSAWVFPGGALDPSDHAAHAYGDGLDDATASAQLGIEQGGLAYHAAAVRECFEEAGLLLAQAHEEAADLAAVLTGIGEQQLAQWRGALQRGDGHLGELCQAAGLRLGLSQLIYLSHWVTPTYRPKRFDTRFFVTAAPPDQIAEHDGGETVDRLWLRPADALARGPEFKLMTPTRTTLAALAQFERVEAALAWARNPRDMSLLMPRLGVGAQGLRPVTPDEPSWAEIGWLDPHGKGTACYDIQPGRALRLSERVIRVTADNGSVMTGPGTNAYLVGGGPRNEWALIDPGPNDAAHVQAVLAAAPGPIRWILATHTHTDHSPATVAVKAATGAPVMGRLPAHPQWQDATFAPDRILHGGERLQLNETTTLRVIHTPGHASNHLCFLLEEEKTLFTGDHVMQLSTVVINPPDGDMAAYVSSLRELLALDLEWLAPGHGFLMAQPQQAMQWIIAHRLKREDKVADALRALGPTTLADLLPRVYDDVPTSRHAIATRSLLAHLLKLGTESRARETDGRWALVG